MAEQSVYKEVHVFWLEHYILIHTIRPKENQLKILTLSADFNFF